MPLMLAEVQFQERLAEHCSEKQMTPPGRENQLICILNNGNRVCLLAGTPPGLSCGSRSKGGACPVQMYKTHQCSGNHQMEVSETER